eukprot:CAMPEP_0204529878 /NCGR_PEP_ID=MMETSP0661-20131031/10311_1 /ASSEMBLY_ACC=CAM_ASM_000606 /TAXON_ID=109239 /ORGANISM="Alexandrium margalefi, Strain AMGDE01CS-322" /LENGTH=54 /DNA_ID=CAMNT_0051535929 /DNA_START=21 /DNA_END=182 /DNA_ORIENTATION=-
MSFPPWRMHEQAQAGTSGHFRKHRPLTLQGAQQVSCVLPFPGYPSLADDEGHID